MKPLVRVRGYGFALLSERAYQRLLGDAEDRIPRWHKVLGLRLRVYRGPGR